MSDGPDRLELARRTYRAFAAGDREAIERLLADELAFFSPPDPGLDRAGYFERCWPNAGGGTEFEFVRLFERGDEVFVTYEGRRTDGTAFRNTEVLTFAGDRIAGSRSTSAGTSERPPHAPSFAASPSAPSPGSILIRFSVNGSSGLASPGSTVIAPR